jgi:hypothetical protein
LDSGREAVCVHRDDYIGRTRLMNKKKKKNPAPKKPVGPRAVDWHGLPLDALVCHSSLGSGVPCQTVETPVTRTPQCCVLRENDTLPSPPSDPASRVSHQQLRGFFFFLFFFWTDTPHPSPLRTEGSFYCHPYKTNRPFNRVESRDRGPTGRPSNTARQALRTVPESTATIPAHSIRPHRRTCAARPARKGKLPESLFRNDE